MRLYHDGCGGAFTVETTNYSSREVSRRSLLVELLCDAGARRYQMRGEEFHYHHRGDRQEDAVESLGRLVGDLVRFAPHAAVNRGAAALRAGSAQLFAYPNRTAFEEEIRWLLWRRAASSGEQRPGDPPRPGP